MFLTARSVDVHDLAALAVHSLETALDVDGPPVISIEGSQMKCHHSQAFLGYATPRSQLKPSITQGGAPQCRCPHLRTSLSIGVLPIRIDGVIRVETALAKEKATPIIMEGMRSVYPHDEVSGTYCTVNDYVDCPPDELYDWLADTRCLEEWTYSLRGFEPTEEPGLWVALRQTRWRDRQPDLHPHCRQPRIADDRLPLRLGSGKTLG